MRHCCYLAFCVFAITVLIGPASISFAQVCRLTTTLRFINEHGQPVTTVTADQLRAEIGGERTRIVSLSPNPKPFMVVVIDNSSSIKGTWKESISAAKELAKAAGDDVAVVVFRDRIVATANGRGETATLLNQLATMAPARGGTALYDTLIEVAGRIKTRNAAIVLISDGEDNASSHSSDQTAHLFLQSSWPPVFGLILDYDHRETQRWYFKKIVDATGGSRAIPFSAPKVAEAVANLSAEVLASFTVSMQVSRSLSKAARLKVEIIGPDNKPLSHITALHIPEVQGCDSTEAVGQQE